jgi:hypothetical protein
MTSAQVSGWAYRIHGNLEDATVSVGMIVSWMQNNLFKINTSLPVTEDFVLSGDSIVPEMSQAVSGIYEEMYYYDYMARKARLCLGAAAYDWVEFNGEDQGTVRRVSKNEQAKTWRLLAQDAEKKIKELVIWYEDTYLEYPMADQVLYNDRFSNSEAGLQCFIPPDYLYSTNNTVWCNCI